jgi:small subunit ribosomal protein S16
VDAERVAYWLGVGAQPTEPVLAILKKTGDWQKFKGEPAPAPLLVAEPKATRPSFEALGGDDEGKGEAITQKKKAEKKDEAAAESESTEA